MYACQNVSLRNTIWGDLDRMCIDSPWMLIDDFNCVLKAEERSSDSRASSNFVEWVDRCGLIDLGNFGPRFTWQHGVSASTRRAVRLDKILSKY